MANQLRLRGMGLRLVLIMVTQFCEYSKNNWIVQFKLVNYVVNEISYSVRLFFFKEEEGEERERKI